MPHLDDALAAVEQWPGAELFLDLHERRLDLPSAVAARVAQSGVASRTLLLAFYWERELLLRAREVFPAVRFIGDARAPVEFRARVAAGDGCIVPWLAMATRPKRRRASVHGASSSGQSGS